MSRFHHAFDEAARPQRIGGPRRTAAFRGFIDDVAVLFAMMLGRDMVQRGPAVVPETFGDTEVTPAPH